jgi:ABC-2 type transport system permease protein
MPELLRWLAARNAFFLLATAALLAAFQYFICLAVASVNIGGALQAVLGNLPPALRRAAMAQLFGGASPQGLLAFGWNHPVAHALGAALAILLGSRAIAGEIESGALELHLAQPLRRAGYLAAQIGFALAALGLLTAAGLAGTLVGQGVYDLPRFPAAVLARLAAGFWLLQCAWFALALALSSFGREGGRVASRAFLLALASYFGQVIGLLIPRAAPILPCTLHHYFAPQAILIERAPVAGDLAVLAGVAAVGLAAAGWRFGRRDVP